MIPKEPGVYPGVPYADYHQAPGINSSILTHFGRSALHARQAMLAPDEPTAAQAFGTAAHTLILEPERFATAYAPSIKVDRRTTVGKAEWAAWLAANQGREAVDPDDWAALHSIREAVLANETARGLLTGPGANEVVLLWIDEDTKIPCKLRMDRLGEFAGFTFAADFKTSEDASPNAFARQAANLHYHEAAAFYLDGLATLGSGAEARFVHIVAEKSAPFGVATYELSDEAIDAGRRTYRGNLARYAEAVESGKWPGYLEGIHPLDLPRWAMRATEE